TQMAFQGVTLQPGEARRYAIFNPLSLQTDSLSVTVLGTELMAWSGRSLPVTRVMVRYSNTTAYAWLDQAGQVVKEEAPLGLVLWRESQAEALGSGWEDSTPLDLVATAAIAVPQALPDPQTLGLLRLKIVGAEDATLFTFPPRQQYHEGILTVTRENTTTITSYTLPYTDSAFAADLATTPFVQSAHPRLIAQARRILGTARDAVQATRLLLDWTYTTLAKELSLGVPTALDVLDRQKGDCNEHAVLFTALARAVGLPARIAAGVVYLHGAFYYHAWSEVWLGQWVSVDPVFHQFPADATHVKFVQGGPEEQRTLLQVIGRLGIEVVAYQ
ncbi:MAG TPA: transglutaminase-like domain-containing protein, partial [Candidatus Tectomicrobia bacterium]